MDELERDLLKKFHYDNYVNEGRVQKLSYNMQTLNELYVDDISNNYIQRKALIDPCHINNNKHEKSHAHNKYRWHGSNGYYKTEDIVPWFQTYNQTNIAKAK